MAFSGSLEARIRQDQVEQTREFCLILGATVDRKVPKLYICYLPFVLYALAYQIAFFRCSGVAILRLSRVSILSVRLESCIDRVRLARLVEASQHQPRLILMIESRRHFECRRYTLVPVTMSNLHHPNMQQEFTQCRISVVTIWSLDSTRRLRMQIRWSPSHSYADGPIIGVIRYGTRILVQWSCIFIIRLCWFGVVTKRAHHMGPYTSRVDPRPLSHSFFFSVTLWVRISGERWDRGHSVSFIGCVCWSWCDYVVALPPGASSQGFPSLGRYISRALILEWGWAS